MPKRKPERLTRKKLDQLYAYLVRRSTPLGSLRPDPDHPGFAILSTTIARYRMDKRHRLVRIPETTLRAHKVVVDPAYKTAEFEMAVANMNESFVVRGCGHQCKKCRAAGRGRK